MKSRKLREVFVVDGCRTPFLKACGRPGPFSASDLAFAAGRSLLARQPFQPEDLDEVINHIIEDPADQTLARRIVRVLILHNIHPTTRLPTVKALAALVSCAVSDRDPDLNIQFVAEAILDNLVEESRFLVKQPADSGDPLSSSPDPSARASPVGARNSPAPSTISSMARAERNVPVSRERR